MCRNPDIMNYICYICLKISVCNRNRFSWHCFYTYFVMLILAFVGYTFPATVVDWAKIGANANAFLAMILLGQSIRFVMPREQLKELLRLLVIRLAGSLVMSLAMYYLLPFPYEIRKILALIAWAPVPVVGLFLCIKAKCKPSMAANLNSLSVACSVVIVSTLLTIL